MHAARLACMHGTLLLTCSVAGRAFAGILKVFKIVLERMPELCALILHQALHQLLQAHQCILIGR